VSTTTAATTKQTCTCGFVAQTARGLRTHERARHPERFGVQWEFNAEGDLVRAEQDGIDLGPVHNADGTPTSQTLAVLGEETYTLTVTRAELAQLVGSLDTTVRHREGQPLRYRLKALYNETAVRPQYAGALGQVRSA
jgi:hypothetical protein